MQPPRGRPPPRPVFPSPSCWSARSISVVPLTVQGYFERWVADKVPPEVRRAQANDYRRHMKGCVLPVLGDMPLEAVTARDILGLFGRPLEPRVYACEDTYISTVLSLKPIPWIE